MQKRDSEKKRAILQWNGEMADSNDQDFHRVFASVQLFDSDIESGFQSIPNSFVCIVCRSFELAICLPIREQIQTASEPFRSAQLQPA